MDSITRSGQKYFTSLKWRDFTNAMEELSHISRFSKNQSLEIFFHACDSIAYDKEIVDKVLGMDIRLENCRPYAITKPRTLKKAVGILCKILLQDEENGQPEIYQYSAISLIAFYSNNNLTQLQLKPFFYREVLSVLRECIKLDSLGDHMKLQLCTIINDLEDFEKEMLKMIYGNSKISSFIRGITNQQIDQVELMGKVSTLRWNPVYLRILKSMQDVLSVDVLDYLLDLFHTCQVQDKDVKELVRIQIEANQHWRLDWRATILSKSFEFSNVLLSSTNDDESLFSKIYSDVVICTTQILLQLSDGQQTDLLAKATCKTYDLLSMASERNFSLETVRDVIIPKYVQVATNYEGEERDIVFKYCIDYGLLALQAFKAEELLTVGFNSIINFFDNCLGFQLHKDGGILIKNLQISILFLRQRIETVSLVNFFETSLPKSFFEFSQWDVGDDRKISLIKSILEIGYLTTKNGVNRFKSFIFYYPQIYARISQRFDLSGEEQSTLLEYCIQALTAALNKGCNVEQLLSDGIPTLLDVFSDSSLAEICSMMDYIRDRYETNSNYSLLLLLKYCYDFLNSNFEKEQVKVLFKQVMKRSKRQEIKMLNEMCVREFLNPKYERIRKMFIGENLSAREFEGLVTILSQIVSMNAKGAHESIAKITQSVLHSVADDLEAHKLDKKRIKYHVETVSKIELFKAIFKDELDSISQKSVEEVVQIFEKKFPLELIKDETYMEVFLQLGKRLENTRQSLDHIRLEGVKCVNEFLNFNVSPEKPDSTKLRERVKHLNEYILSLPKNISLRQHLIDQGYSEDLWKRDLYIQVEVDDKKNIEENFRIALLGCFGEYVDILKSLNVQKVQINGEDTNVDLLFGGQEDTLSVEDLKSRRILATKIIDQVADTHLRKNFYINRKLTLLAKESQLENECEKKKSEELLLPSQKKTYWARFNITFLSTAGSSASNIVGCYAPDGAHCEKPIELGIKVNGAVIGIFEENREKGKEGTMGAEIENIEVLMTDQGLFIFKLYSNGHPYDTSLVWISLFKALVEAQYVPAIIIPKGFPNQRTFSILSTFIPEEYSSSFITYRDDFFEESGVDSYYDFKPEKIKEGDIILNSENVSNINLPDLNLKGSSLSMRSTRTVIRTSTDLTMANSVPRQVSKTPLRKDFSGTILVEVMKDPTVSHLQANIFGKFLFQYINKFITTGERDAAALQLGSDLDEWNSRRKVKSERLTDEQRTTLVPLLISCIHNTIDQYYSIDPSTFYEKNRGHFYELKAHLEALIYGKKIQNPRKKRLLQEMKDFISKQARLYEFIQLGYQSQMDIMRWIFRNEDKVWRERGGRPGEENFVIFLGFIAPRQKGSNEIQHGYSKDHFGQEPWGGLVLFAEQPLFDQDSKNLLKLSQTDIVGYLIGDFISPKEYEVVAAWVDKRFKGMDLAVRMYFKAMVEARKRGCSHLVFDLIEGGIKRIINATPAFRFMCAFGIHKFCFTTRKESYTTEISDTKKEHFEKVYLNLDMIVPAMHTFRTIMKMASRFSSTANHYAQYFDFLDGPAIKTETKKTSGIGRWTIRITTGIALTAIITFILKKTVTNQ